MTKVCHMTNVHGVEDVRIFQKECVSLAKAGYEVYLVERGESYEKNGVHIVGVGDIPADRLRRMTEGAKKVYEAAKQIDADVYHLHDPELLPYGLKLKKAGKKVIFDSHEDYRVMLRYKPYLPAWICRIVAAAYSRYEQRVLRQIDGVIFPALKDGRHPFAGQCRHLAVVNNVPRMEELYDLYDPGIQKYERSVVYIGIMTYNRGITHMIQAASRCSCTAYLGGDFSTEEYQAEIQALPEYACVHYLGHLSRQEVLKTLQRCQIGMANILNVAQYNQYDNLATKVYEYMSLGIPVILSDSPFNTQVMEKYHFGICVKPDDVDAVANTIRYLLDHPDEARRMGENGRRAVREEFNWDSEAKKLTAFYAEILKD